MVGSAELALGLNLELKVQQASGSVRAGFDRFLILRVGLGL